MSSPADIHGAREKQDALRWRKVRALTTIEVAEMSPDMHALHERLIRGGWYTEDLDEMIDALEIQIDQD